MPLKNRKRGGRKQPPRQAKASQPVCPKSAFESNFPFLQLPSELLLHIIQGMDGKSKVNLICASHSMYDLITPILYERLSITPENAWGVFRGLARKVHPPLPEDGYFYRNRDPEITLCVDDFKSFKKKERKVNGTCDQDNHGPLSVTYKLKEEDYADAFDRLTRESSSETLSERPESFGPRSQPYEATSASHARKLALLNHVRHLSIASIPTNAFSEHLLLWNKLFATAHREHGKSVLFPNVSTMCYQGNAVYQLAEVDREYLDEYDDGLYDYKSRFPFLRALSASNRPLDICYEIPLCDDERYCQWLRRTCEEKEMRQVFDSKGYERGKMLSSYHEYEDSIETVTDLIVEASRPTCRSVTVHAAHNGDVPFGIQDVRIFLSDKFARSNGPYGEPKYKDMRTIHRDILWSIAKVVGRYRSGREYYHCSRKPIAREFREESDDHEPDVIYYDENRNEVDSNGNALVDDPVDAEEDDSEVDEWDKEQLPSDDGVPSPVDSELEALQKSVPAGTRSKVEHWELICPLISRLDRRYPSLDRNAIREIPSWWPDLNKEVGRREPQWREEDVTMTYWENTTPCICCRTMEGQDELDKERRYTARKEKRRQEEQKRQQAK
ncbi:hypothetical protein IAU59_006446 [Kwoniella sp. CBS 9459]